MSQYVEASVRGFTAGAAIGQHLRVYLTSSNTLALAGANDYGIGTMEDPATAANEQVSVRLNSAMGTRKCVANAAITVGDPVYLAASGKVGYDLHHGSFFGRVLPLGSRALTQLNPRLGSAAALLDADAVTLDESGLRAVVVSGDHHHVVNLVTTSADGARCTCAWYAKHRGGRGPCKHVLAAVAVVRRAEP